MKQRRVLEWSRQTDGWQPLPKDAVIEDPCLVRPLPIQALLDAASSDDAVARALLQKRVPALEVAIAEGEARGEATGELRMAREAISMVLQSRGVEVPAEVARAIADCHDSSKLRRWLKRAATAATAAEVVAGSRRRR